ncbi:MAG: hypothetical protein IPN42_09020 [Methylococcaceae bacterium]|nr:hypothetical protein [Methylococcaceae bacterium]
MSSAFTCRYKDLIGDYRKIFTQISPENPLTVIYKMDLIPYRIFNVSVFDPKKDIGNLSPTITSRQFKDHTAFYLNSVRDFLFCLIITVHGKPKYIIKPTLGIVRCLKKQLNLRSRVELAEFILQGNMPLLLGGNPIELRQAARKLNSKYKRIKSENLELKKGNSEKSDEINQLFQKIDKLGCDIRNLEMERKIYRDKLIAACNPNPYK